jgi:hypothetical protein
MHGGWIHDGGRGALSAGTGLVTAGLATAELVSTGLATAGKARR